MGKDAYLEADNFCNASVSGIRKVFFWLMQAMGKTVSGKYLLKFPATLDIRHWFRFSKSQKDYCAVSELNTVAARVASGCHVLLYSTAATEAQAVCVAFSRAEPEESARQAPRLSSRAHLCSGSLQPFLPFLNFQNTRQKKLLTWGTLIYTYTVPTPVLQFRPIIN